MKRDEDIGVDKYLEGVIELSRFCKECVLRHENFDAGCWCFFASECVAHDFCHYTKKG